MGYKICYDDFETLIEIANKGDEIMDMALKQWDSVSDDWDLWEPVYNKIFSSEIYGVINNILDNFDPYIPDTTYQEDVCSFWSAFKQELEILEVC